MVLRAAAALVWTGGIFATFLALRGVDIAVRAIAPRSSPGLAPRVLQLWARGVLALLGLRLRRRGAPMAHPGAIVANHSSWLDIVVLQSAAPVVFVAKSEVAGWPVIGRIVRAIGTVLIERRPTEAARQSAALHARLARGDQLAFFPEGTSTDGSRVLPFKSALFGVFFAPDLKDALRIQPVTIAYRAPPELPPAFYGWWGDMAFGAHLATVLALSRGGVVDVTFHPPLRAADYPDRKALADAAGTAVRSAWTVAATV